MSLPDPSAPSSDHDTTSSAASNAEAPTFLTPPYGWTDDPAHMKLHYYWQGHAGDLKELLTTCYGLADPKPLLTRGPGSGDVMFLLQSRDNKDSETETKYYVWNDIECELCLIKSPTSLKEIYKTINETEGYLRGLEMEIADVDSEGEDDDNDEDD